MASPIGKYDKQCSAHSKQTGEQCKQPAIRGGTVCRFHGGSAPAVKAKADEKLKALVDPAIDALADIINDLDPSARQVRLAAARDLLDRTGHGAASKHEVSMDISVKEAEVLQLLDELVAEESKDADSE